MMKKHRVLLLLLLSLLVLPTTVLAVIGFTSSGTASCQTCLQANQRVLKVSFSELMLSPEKHRDQLIQVEAIFDHDAGYTFLRDPVNTNWQQSLPTGFGKDFVACPATQKVLAVHTGLGTWYDGVTFVTVIGKYGVIEDQRDFQTGQTGFTLMCLEQVKSPDTIKSISINTIRYSIGQIGKRLFHPLGKT